MSQEVSKKASKWVITPIYPIYKQVITPLLTIDPNLKIQHVPSMFLPTKGGNLGHLGLFNAHRFFPVAFEHQVPPFSAKDSRHIDESKV